MEPRPSARPDPADPTKPSQTPREEARPSDPTLSPPPASPQPNPAYGSSYGREPQDPFAPLPPLPPLPVSPTSDRMPAGQPNPPGQGGYQSAFNTPLPYDQQPTYAAPSNSPYEPPTRPVQPTQAFHAPPTAPPTNPSGQRTAAGGGNGAMSRSGSVQTWGPRRRKRTNPVAIVVASAIAAIATIALIVFVVNLFNDDDGGGNNNNAANANATATRAAELAQLAALTPPAETPTAPAATEPAASDEGSGDENAEDQPTEEAAPPAEEADNSNEDNGDQAEEQPTEASSDEEASSEEPTLTSFFPSRREIPDGFALSDESDFTEEQVAESLGTDDAADNLSEWGWREGGVRTYTAADAASDATNVLIVSVHHFGSSSDAKAALTYFADTVAEAQGLDALDVDRIANQTRALQGQTTEGANQVVLYVRSGPYLIRVAGTSLEGDPTDAVVALAQQLAGD